MLMPKLFASIILLLKILYFFITSFKSFFIISICFSKFKNNIDIINIIIELFHITIYNNWNIIYKNKININDIIEIFYRKIK